MRNYAKLYVKCKIRQNIDKYEKFNKNTKLYVK